MTLPANGVRRSALPNSLLPGLREIILHPWQTLVPPWSWKAAAINALFRGGFFFVNNLKAGTRPALQAMLLEGVYAVLTAGLIGAVSQRLRAAKPLWATASLTCLVLPGIMILAQFAMHRLVHTPHVGAGIVVSLVGSILCAAFTLFAMRRGSLLGGDDSTTIRHDIGILPQITLDFVLALPRMLLRS